MFKNTLKVLFFVQIFKKYSKGCFEEGTENDFKVYFKGIYAEIF